LTLEVPHELANRSVSEFERGLGWGVGWDEGATRNDEKKKKKQGRLELRE